MPSLHQLLAEAPPHFPSLGAFLKHFRDDVSPAPSQNSLDRFYNLALGHCANFRQAKALFQLSRLGLGGTGQLVFTALDRRTVTYQLYRRILDPGQVNQGSFGLCGPAALAVMLARDDPFGFAQFALKLAETGQAVFRYKQVKPAAQILRFNPKPHGIGEADFLLLASLRDSPATLTDKTQFAQYDGTGLDWMYDWMVKAGYPLVLQVMVPPSSGALKKIAYAFVSTFQREQYVLRCHPNVPGIFGISGLNPSDKLQVLKAACFFSALGWKIMLGGSASIAKSAPEFERAEGLAQAGAPPLMVEKMRASALLMLNTGAEQHWMLAEELDILGKKLRVKLWTWSGYYETSHMPLDAFLGVFMGFVAASPLPLH